MLGDQARYQFRRHFSDIPQLQASLPSDDYTFDFLEFYALDLLSHWHLDRPSVMDAHLRDVDAFVHTLHQQCEKRGVTMILLVDHGHERIRDTINLKRVLKQTSVPRKERTCFIECLSPTCFRRCHQLVSNGHWPWSWSHMRHN